MTSESQVEDCITRIPAMAIVGELAVELSYAMTPYTPMDQRPLNFMRRMLWRHNMPDTIPNGGPARSLQHQFELAAMMDPVRPLTY